MTRNTGWIRGARTCLAILAVACVPLSAVGQVFLTRADLGRADAYDPSGANLGLALSGLRTPWGIAASETNLFVADYTRGTVGKYKLDGAVINAELITGLNGPSGIAVSGSDLFVANLLTGTVGKYGLDGAPINTALIQTASGAAVSIAATPTSVFVAEQNPGRVSQYTHDGTVINDSLFTDARGIFDITAAKNMLFYSDQVWSSLGAYNLSTGELSTRLLRNIEAPTGLDFDGTNLWAVSNRGTVYRYDDIFTQLQQGTPTPTSVITDVPGTWSIAVVRPTAAAPDSTTTIGVLGFALTLLFWLRRHHVHRPR